MNREKLMPTRHCQFGNPIPKRTASGKLVDPSGYRKRVKCADQDCACQTPNRTADAWAEIRDAAADRFIYGKTA